LALQDLNATAERLGQNRRTLQRWIKAGCPHERRGKGARGKLWFDYEAVVAWMQAVGRTGQRGPPTVSSRLLTAAAASGSAAAPAGKPATAADKLTPAQIAAMTLRVNLQIKQLDRDKRARIEAVETGDLHDVAECQRATLRKVHAVKAVHQALPGKLSQRIAGLFGQGLDAGELYDRVYGLLERELDAVQEEFARG